MNFQNDRIDLHIHTDFSDGSCSLEEAVNSASIKKLDLFAITDHYSEFLKLPKRMTQNQLKNYLNMLEEKGVIKGVEVDILSDGVSISKESASFCDIVLGGIHFLRDIVFWYDNRPISNSKSFVEEIRIMLIQAMESNLLDILVHPTWLPESIRPQTKKLITKNWIKSIVKCASSHCVAIEISGAWKTPDETFVLECLRQGVKLAIGSDAHNASMIGDTQYPVNLLKRIDASPETIYIPIKK
ncbi:MAG: PHP domain-containing protein [Candidatus Bathyarchaeia archaeon]